MYMYKMYATEIDESTVCMGPSNSSLPCVLSCGHPCLMCLQSQSIDTSILASDHQYSKNVSSKPNVATKSIVTNTDESTFESYSTLNQQGGGGGGKLVLPPSTFQSGEGDCPQLLCP